MSNSTFADFLAQVEKDSALKDRFTSIKTPEEMAEFAASLGYSFSTDEIRAQAGALGGDQMSDDDLGDISGGQSMMGSKPTQCWYSGD